jgi:protein-S-isoprenylcysteine O-methyltransferase Ste14
MGRLRASAGSVVFLAAAPGVFAGLGPWLLTGWSSHGWPLPVRLLGVALIVAGLVVLLPAFGRFAIEGIGTPAPVAPTERLVVGGTYRYARNPMYIAVMGLIVGQALLLGQVLLFPYVACFAAAVAGFVRGYEEPTLARQFGEEYDAYRRAVPAWLPRSRPWDGSIGPA